MKKLLNNKKGFTLIEMLIVVAIIVILVAVSIPVFTANLNETRQATDAANLRAAKSVATMAAINGTVEDGAYHYDIEAGTLVSGDGDAIGECSAHDGAFISVTIEDGAATVEWSDGTTDCGGES